MTKNTLTLRSLDIPQLHKFGIGFDTMFDELHRIHSQQVNTNYPPYNVVQINEDEYMIRMAVAGFGPDNLSVKLLDLLGRCLEAQMHFAADDKQRRSFFKVFDAMGAIAGKKLSLTSRVVRYVFRITGNRASAYARVLDIALSAKITPAELATWVREHGGIEEVRRNYAAGEAPAAKQQAKQAAAEDALGSASTHYRWNLSHDS